jgi:uncharacterized membrane protein
MAISAPSTSRLQIRLRSLSETYWFWPLLLGFAGFGTALIVLALDQTFTFKVFYETYSWIKVPLDSARAVLTVIAGAMISAASIVYSLSLLIRTIAIGTLGPRLIEAFDKIHVNRVTLGIQLFSFVYSLTVLYSIGNIVDQRTLSVAVGVVIAIVALTYLVVFVHSVARQAHVDATIADIATILTKRIDRETSEGSDAGAEFSQSKGKGTVIECQKSGYVQGIDRNHAFELACAEDLIVIYEVRSGDYLLAGLPLLRVAAKKKPSDDLRDRLAHTVTIGLQRIDAEDLRFECLLLVEIALRALSSGVNDPFTAVACIDNLSGVLARVNGRDLTPDPLRDNDDKVRVISKRLSYQDLVDSIFHPLRQSGAQVPTVAICLLERISGLVRVTEDKGSREHLMRHAELIGVAACEATSDKGDQESFESRLAALRGEFKKPIPSRKSGKK